jgi:hypothetical protein
MKNFIKSILKDLLSLLLAIDEFILLDMNFVDHLAQETNIEFESTFSHGLFHFGEIILQVVFDG